MGDTTGIVMYHGCSGIIKVVDRLDFCGLLNYTLVKCSLLKCSLLKLK